MKTGGNLRIDEKIIPIEDLTDEERRSYFTSATKEEAILWLNLFCRRFAKLKDTKEKNEHRRKATRTHRKIRWNQNYSH